MPELSSPGCDLQVEVGVWVVADQKEPHDVPPHLAAHLSEPELIEERGGEGGGTSNNRFVHDG